MSSQKPSRSFQGRVNHAQGQLFEGRIEAALRRYQQRGEAVVEKTPEPMRPLQRLEGGRFLAVFEKPAQPDYKGTLRGGRAVVFEAKHTSTGRMTQDRVTGEQAKRLDQHQRAGGTLLCGVRFWAGCIPHPLEAVEIHAISFWAKIHNATGRGRV